MPPCLPTPGTAPLTARGARTCLPPRTRRPPGVCRLPPRQLPGGADPAGGPAVCAGHWVGHAARLHPPGPGTCHAALTGRAGWGTLRRALPPRAGGARALSLCQLTSTVTAWQAVRLPAWQQLSIRKRPARMLLHPLLASWLPPSQVITMSTPALLQAWASAVAEKLEVQLERLGPGSGFKQAS